MPDGLTGLTGLATPVRQIDADNQATAEQRLGGIADPRHGIPGEQATPYPWQSKATQAAGPNVPLGPENQMLGDEWWFWEPGGTSGDDPWEDHTPSTHAAPEAKSVTMGRVPSANDPDQTARQLIRSHGIHSYDLGASERMQHNLDALQDDWELYQNTDAGHSDQVPIPRQMMSSGFMWGTRDRVQSMALQNSYEFDTHHWDRRVATGPIPGNTYWMRPGGRPMVKNMPGPARPPIGNDTPFAGDDLGAAFGINGAVLQNIPTDYVTPPTPQIAAASTATGDDAVVSWW